MDIIVILGAAARVRVENDKVIVAPAPFSWMLGLDWGEAQIRLLEKGGSFLLFKQRQA